MHLSMKLLLLSTCVYAHTMSARELYNVRSGRGVYSSEYSTDYEPPMYAAIPLHGPVPVPILQVLSRTPLSRERTRSPTVHHPVYTQPPYYDNEYARPSYQDNDYASAHNQYEYASQGVNDAHNYKYSSTYSQFYTSPTSSEAQDELAILYARPNLHGGFSYRRNPAKTVPKRSPTSTTESPVIIRVHRHRIVRDR